jgi:hypothetical protein
MRDQFAPPSPNNDAYEYVKCHANVALAAEMYFPEESYKVLLTLKSSQTKRR